MYGNGDGDGSNLCGNGWGWGQVWMGTVGDGVQVRGNGWGRGQMFVPVQPSSLDEGSQQASLAKQSNYCEHSITGSNLGTVYETALQPT